MQHVLLIRHSSALRQISRSDALLVVDETEVALERRHIEVSTAHLGDAVEQGDWNGHGAYLRQSASKIRQDADDYDAASIHYLGLAEVPHIVALGAYLGYERDVVPHDHHGEAGPWRWPSVGRTVSLKLLGSESLGTVVEARGEAVMSVSISAAINDRDIREAVGDGMLAQVGLTLDLENPRPGAIKSKADVAAVRDAFRDLFCRLRNARPGVELIHLFVAAPPSVCFAVGQELNPRNAPPVQTYRYRTGDGTSPRQQAAILISDSDGQRTLTPLSDEEKSVAVRLRTHLWPAVVNRVENYCRNLKVDGKTGGPWFDHLVHREALRRAAPFPALPALADFLPSEVTVSPESPENREYFLDPVTGSWHLSDRLLVGLEKATKDEAELEQLISLFLFHEYVHLFHSLGKRTAEEVGKFANCLEHIDYTADTYALLHQLDFYRGRLPQVLDENGAIHFLCQQIDLVIKSFWAFDEGTGNEWQVRRLRRYMNWYWRLAQMQRVEDIDTAMVLFTSKPHVELCGMRQISRGRRTFARLDKLDPTTFLEMAIILENEKLYRLTESPNAKLSDLLYQFLCGGHDEIKGIFDAVYDIAEGNGGAVLPQPRFASAQEFSKV